MKFLWNMLRSCNIDFISSDRKGALISSDKEFNEPSVHSAMKMLKLTLAPHK